MALTEYIVKNSLLPREDKSFLFPTLSRKVGMPLDLSSLTVPKKKPQCSRDLSSTLLGTAPPKVHLESEGLSGSQALDFVILLLATAMIKLQSVAKSSMISSGDRKQHRKFILQLEAALNDLEGGLKGFVDQMIKIDPTLPLDLWILMAQRNAQMYEDCSAMAKLMDNLLSFTRARTETFIEQQVLRHI